MQVCHLTAEVQRLQGNPLSGPGTSIADTLTAEQLLNSQSVISSRLVSFSTLQDLIEQNRWVEGQQSNLHSLHWTSGHVARFSEQVQLFQLQMCALRDVLDACPAVWCPEPPVPTHVCRRLLALSRSLSAENERTSAELRADLANEYGRREQQLKHELEQSQALVQVGARTAVSAAPEH